MARTGRFGRLPRAAPDLSATIMSMVEQYESARDRNIIDAWEHGGKFEGKKVTDGMLLDHFRTRMGEVSKDDPMYDYWKNTLWQYRFSIAEQKVNLAYERGTIKEGGVASFYRQWAQRVPQQSAVYRDLMTSAAQFANAANAGSQASSAQSKYDAAMRAVAAIDKQRVQPAMNAIGYIQAVAAMSSGTADVNDFNISEAADFEDILATAADDPTYGPLLKAAYDWAFPGKQTGDLSVKQVQQLLSRGLEGTRDQLKILKRGGYSTSTVDASVQTLKAGRAQLRRVTSHVASRYMELNEDLTESLDDESIAGDPGAQVELMQYHGEELLKLAEKLRMSDPVRSGRLFAEAQAWMGKDPKTDNATVGEDWNLSESGPEGMSPTESQQEAAREAVREAGDVDLPGGFETLDAVRNSRLLMQETHEGMVNGSLVLLYDPSIKGPENQKYRAVPVDAVPEGGKLVTVRTKSRVVRDPETGKTTTIPGGTTARVALPIPIYITIGDVNRADDPTVVTGTQVLAGYEYPIGAGEGNTVYSTTLSGREMFTTVKPWSGGAAENVIIDGVRYIRYNTATAKALGASLSTPDADGNVTISPGKLLNPEQLSDVDMTDVVKGEPIERRGAEGGVVPGDNPQVGPDGVVVGGEPTKPSDKAVEVLGNRSGLDLGWVEGAKTLFGHGRKEGESDVDFFNRAYTSPPPSMYSDQKTPEQRVAELRAGGDPAAETAFWDDAGKKAKTYGGRKDAPAPTHMVGYDKNAPAPGAGGTTTTPPGGATPPPVLNQLGVPTTPPPATGTTTDTAPVSTSALLYPQQSNVAAWSTMQTAIIGMTADRMWTFGEGKGDFPSPVESFKWAMEHDEAFKNDPTLQKTFWDEARIMMNNAASTKDMSQAAAHMALYSGAAGAGNPWYTGAVSTTTAKAAQTSPTPLVGNTTGYEGRSLRDIVDTTMSVINRGAIPGTEREGAGVIRPGPNLTLPSIPGMGAGIPVPRGPGLPLTPEQGEGIKSVTDQFQPEHPFAGQSTDVDANKKAGDMWRALKDKGGPTVPDFKPKTDGYERGGLVPKPKPKVPTVRPAPSTERFTPPTVKVPKVPGYWDEQGPGSTPQGLPKARPGGPWVIS